MGEIPLYLERRFFMKTQSSKVTFEHSLNTRVRQQFSLFSLTTLINGESTEFTGLQHRFWSEIISYSEIVLFSHSAQFNITISSSSPN